MATLELNQTFEELKPALVAADAAKTEPPSNGTPFANKPDRPARDGSGRDAGSSHEPPPYFAEALHDAERMLKFAAETGLDVNRDIRNSILQARASARNGWNQETTSNLLTALTQLAVQLKPVTAQTLRACDSDQTRKTVRSYWKIAVCLAVVIVPFSVVSFVTSAISEAVRKDIATANELAVKLRSQLGPGHDPSQTPGPTASAPDPTSAPASASASLPGVLSTGDVITELQTFASTIRSIDARGRQLNALVFYTERDPFAGIRKNPAKTHSTFQLPVGLPNFADAAQDRTLVYQDVRYFAQNLLDDVSFFYGAISTCILPVLYALLGTCAYLLLRSFEHQISTHTLTPTIANSARFLIAAIGGAIVGLFNNFTVTQSASIPPLAIAFLVGYAVDVFFAFLEGLLQTFTKGSASSQAPSAGSAQA